MAITSTHGSAHLASHEPAAATPLSIARRRFNEVRFPIVDDSGCVVTEERRRGDRRNFSERPQFPLRDMQGELVASNRRRRVERRIYRTRLSADPRGARLPKILLDSGEALYELTCDGDLLTLGRDPGCDLVAPVAYVSRVHARIIRDGGRFVLVDSSRNGSFVRVDGVNGERALQYNSLELKGRGVIRLGYPVNDETQFVVRYAIITAV